MSAVIGNLSAYVGSDQTIEDTIYDADGAVQNITGWALAFYVHAYNDPGTVFVTKTTGGSGITIPTGTNGIANIALARADTLNLKNDLYSYYVARTDSGSNDVVSAGLFSLLLR